MYSTRTEWFDGKTQVPAHVGVYERKYIAGIYPCYWTGKFWATCAFDFKMAYNWRDQKSDQQDIPFRGLRVKP
jgi:hypothetical protein